MADAETNPACGTMRGYRAHLRRREKTCVPCRIATNEYLKDRRAKVADIICDCCGKPGPPAAHRWRRACYYRWFKAGKPESGPPEPPPSKKERMAEYEALRGSARLELIAERIGVTVATLKRYDREMQQQQ